MSLLTTSIRVWLLGGSLKPLADAAKELAGQNHILTWLKVRCQLPQAWTHDRTLYLGHVLQKMLRGYTDAAVSITSNLVTIISRFAVQVGAQSIMLHSISQSAFAV